MQWNLGLWLGPAPRVFWSGGVLFPFSSQPFALSWIQVCRPFLSKHANKSLSQFQTHCPLLCSPLGSLPFFLSFLNMSFDHLTPLFHLQWFTIARRITKNFYGCHIMSYLPHAQQAGLTSSHSHSTHPLWSSQCFAYSMQWQRQVVSYIPFSFHSFFFKLHHQLSL